MYAPIVPVENMREQNPDKAHAYDITRAIISRRIHALREVVTSENVNEPMQNYWTPLMYAVHKNRLQSIDYLLSIGADVNARDQKGRTVYHMAASGGHDESLVSILTTVLDRQETVILNEYDEYGDTPLLIACTKGYDDIVHILLEHGADIHIPEAVNRRRSPLMAAASRGHVRAVEELLRHPNPPMVNATDNEGATALIQACAHGHLRAVQSLFQNAPYGNSPDCNIKDNDGWTALMWAIHRGHHKIIRCLMAQTPEPYLWQLAGVPEVREDQDGDSLLELTPKKYRRREDYKVIKQSLHTMIVSTITDSSLFPMTPSEIVRVIACFAY